MAQTYYEILGVAENATSEEIEVAFKKRAREVHPDTVAPGNAYLRQVAAEAFKDLSEAKAALLDPVGRQKYDDRLAYERGAGQARTASAGPPPTSQGAPRSQAAPHSQTAQRAQGAGPSAAPKQRQRYGFWRAADTSLSSFLFVVLGLSAVFFVGWLMWSGRTPPLWLAVLTLSLGLLSFLHGMRPSTNARVRGSSVPLLICGFVLAAILFSISFPSPFVMVTHTTAGRAAPSAPDASTGKAPEHSSRQRTTVAKPTIVTVDESGEGADGTVQIWMDLRDGQIYRTHLSGDTMSLESVSGNPGSVTGITGCEFYRAASAGPSWRGVCRERSRPDQSTRESSATISTFSSARIEGSTSDIPKFAMIPVENVPIGPPASPH